MKGLVYTLIIGFILGTGFYYLCLNIHEVREELTRANAKITVLDNTLSKIIDR